MSLNWLGLLKWRRAQSAHWSERARLLWPVRKGAGTNVFLLPFFLGAVQFAADREFSANCVTAAFAGFFGTLLGTYPLDRQILSGLTFRAWGRLVIITWSFRVVWFGIWIAGVLAMPEVMGWRTFAIPGILIVFIFILNRGLWRKILALTGLLRPPTERLRAIVTAASERMRVPVRGLWLWDVPIANALALPITGELIFTTGLMEACNDEEVSGICAHELTHLAEPKKIVFARMAGSMAALPILFFKPAQARGPLALLAIALAIFLMAFALRKLARRMELRADAAAAKSEEQPGVYAKALENIYRKNQLPAVMDSNRKAHPHLYDRMIAAGLQPDFERPQRASSQSWVYILPWLVFGGIIGWLFAQYQSSVYSSPSQ
jgi:Zn-dependent protease with chaperone function